ncbi:MAG: hypothetical protein V3T31_13720, partial [candidate division Zixibacteria bacterium]
SLDDGNKIALGAFLYSRCPRGSLAGRWGFDEDGRGIFRGMWISQSGELAGWLRGHYGTNDAGRSLFFGKWISRNGRFEGFVRGGWEEADSEGDHDGDHRRAAGQFVGRIYSAGRNEVGLMGGFFLSAPDREGGFFGGRWKIRCPDDQPEHDPFDDCIGGQ